MQKFHRSKRKRPNLAEAEEYLKRGYSWGMRYSDYVSIDDRKRRLDKLQSEIPLMIRQQLGKVRNLELAVLKCHLVIEYMLNQFIDLGGTTEGSLDDARLTFKQKQALVHILGFPSDPAFMPSLDILNNVRNQVAHTLTIDRKLIDKLIRISFRDSGKLEHITDTKRVTAVNKSPECTAECSSL